MTFPAISQYDRCEIEDRNPGSEYLPKHELKCQSPSGRRKSKVLTTILYFSDPEERHYSKTAVGMGKIFGIEEYYGNAGPRPCPPICRVSIEIDGRPTTGMLDREFGLMGPELVVGVFNE